MNTQIPKLDNEDLLRLKLRKVSDKIDKLPYSGMPIEGIIFHTKKLEGERIVILQHLQRLKTFGL